MLGYSIVAGIVIVLAALSLHRFGLRKVMLFGLIVSFVGSLLGVLAWDFPSLVAARLIQAVATGLYFPVVNEALLNLSPKNGAGLPALPSIAASSASDLRWLPSLRALSSPIGGCGYCSPFPQ